MQGIRIVTRQQAKDAIGRMPCDYIAAADWADAVTGEVYLSYGCRADTSCLHPTNRTKRANSTCNVLVTR